MPGTSTLSPRDCKWSHSCRLKTVSGRTKIWRPKLSIKSSVGITFNICRKRKSKQNYLVQDESRLKRLGGVGDLGEIRERGSSASSLPKVLSPPPQFVSSTSVEGLSVMATLCPADESLTSSTSDGNPWTMLSLPKQINITKPMRKYITSERKNKDNVTQQTTIKVI